MAETLEKYQYLFTHDLHLSHSYCTEGHLAERPSLKCLLWRPDPTSSEPTGECIEYYRNKADTTFWLEIVLLLKVPQ